MENDKFLFTGDLDTIVNLFNFIKVPQTALEDSVYEQYQITIEGHEEMLYRIELTVKHHPEEEDKVYFEFISNTFGTGHASRLSIETTLDLTMFINTISIETTKTKRKKP